MRKIFTQVFILILFIPAITKAQLPNGSFESWSLNSFNILEPDGWISYNFGAASSLQYQPGQNQNYGVKLVNDTSQGIFLPGSIETKFACTIEPISLDGYYLGQFKNGDELSIIIYLYNNVDSVIGSGYLDITANAGSYTDFSIPIAYLPGSQPDSAEIIIDFSNGSDFDLNGYVVLDNLQLIGSAAVDEISKSIPVHLWPNPVSDHFQVSVPEFNPENSTIKIIDLTGRTIQAEISNQTFIDQSGQWEIRTDNLSDGLYYLMISDDKKAAAKSFLIAR